VIQDGQIKPSEDKLASIANLSSESLTTKKQIRGALGLINFFRAFIPNCAELALPLTSLLKKNEPEKIKWNAACENALQKLKKALLPDTCSYAPD